MKYHANMELTKNAENFPVVFKKIQNRSFNRYIPIFRRLMTKSGHLNLQLSQVPNCKYFRFTKDFANTLVLIRWRWVTLFVILANFFFYLIFAGIWMFDAWLSGDFHKTNIEEFCIPKGGYFTNYLLLSIETITTTGYGYLYPTENCQFAWVTLTFSTIVMILIDGAFISVVFLKVCKPLKKDAVTIFSAKCVISLRNGKLCLIFSINDHSNKHIIDPRINIYFRDMKKIKEQNFDICLREMEITSHGMLLWPTDIVHEINKNSPLWNLSASDIINNKFEIFATVSGISLVTNQFSTSQTSYLNEEILWGYRFKSCTEFDEKFQRYTINEQDIFKIVPCDTPLCSAHNLRKIKYELNQKDQLTAKSM